MSSAQAGKTDIPGGTIEAVVNLVGTGPVPLGGYTAAEIDAVSGVTRFLDQEPTPEAVAEAVRSLAARNLITTEAGSDDVEVRGDLGVAVAFQQRSRTVLDARVTGSKPDRPWRFVLMPQPEAITLEILVDALGIHFYSLRASDEALDRLWERLPSGDRGPDDADPDAVLAASPQTALVSVSRWDDAGDRETHDVVLARDDERCHVFVRDSGNPDRLVPAGMDDDEWRDMLVRLSSVG